MSGKGVMLGVLAAAVALGAGAYWYLHRPHAMRGPLLEVKRPFAAIAMPALDVQYGDAYEKATGALARHGVRFEVPPAQDPRRGAGDAVMFTVKGKMWDMAQEVPVRVELSFRNAKLTGLSLHVDSLPPWQVEDVYNQWLSGLENDLGKPDKHTRTRDTQLESSRWYDAESDLIVDLTTESHRLHLTLARSSSSSFRPFG